jgi:general secretion pathway protein L
MKAILLELGARGARQLSFFELPRAEGGQPLETLQSTVRELLAAHPLSADTTNVALPGPTLALHSLSLPFKDPKRIDAALPFELESQLPFDLSDAVYDYQVTSREEAKSNLLAGVVRREELGALLAALEAADVDPRVVTHPALAYHNLLALAPQLFGDGPNTPPVAIVDIGHERTCVALGRPVSGVEWARTFAGGGRDLTRALAAEFRTAVPDAHQWKEEHGALGPYAQGPEGERGAAALQRGLQNIIREIRATLKAYAANSRVQPEKVLLCGGTARMPGLADQVSADLGLPAQLLSLPQEVEAAVPQRFHPLAAQAYALALRGTVTGSRAPRFNLRRGPFTFQRDASNLRSELVRLGAFGAGLVLLFLLFTITRSSLLSQRESEVDHQLCQVTQGILGRCEPNFDRALNLLQGTPSPTGAIPKRSAVNLLADLNEHIPKDLSVKFDQVVIDLERVMLRGETDSPRQVDTLSHALEAAPCFKEVKEGKVEKTRSGAGVSFRLDVQVECPDSEGPKQ